MKAICAILFCVIIIMSCSKNEGFFGEMPSSYNSTGLEYYGDVIGNLKTTTVNGGNGLEISCAKCEDEIPFCGILEYRNDTIFYLNESNEKRQVFLILGERALSRRLVKYSPEKNDSIIFIGKSYRKYSNDSVYVYEFKSAIRWSRPADASYLKYISIGKGGIKQFAFWSMNGIIVIDLLKRPTLRVVK